jgi:hypothetical protein
VKKFHRTTVDLFFGQQNSRISEYGKTHTVYELRSVHWPSQSATLAVPVRHIIPKPVQSRAWPKTAWKADLGKSGVILVYCGSGDDDDDDNCGGDDGSNNKSILRFLT